MQKPLGLEKGKVDLHEYDPLWHTAFEKEKELLFQHFPDVILEISHGGSTSVPGMRAKPIIDIFVSMRTLEEYLSMKDGLESLDYEHQGEDGVEGRQFFIKREEGRGTHHLQLMAHNSKHWDNHIVLREYYKAHPEVMAEYIALKSQLAEIYAHDRDAYSMGKKDFVNATLAKAHAFLKEENQS